MGFCIDNYPVTKKNYKEILSIPLYYELSDQDQDLVIDTMVSIF